MRLRFIVFILLFLKVFCYSQNIKEPIFSHISVDQLGFKKIRSITWDKKGNAWGVYQEGIFKYNGFTSQTFKSIKGDSSTLLDKEIRTIYHDSKNNLWILYTEITSISCINTVSLKLTHYASDTNDKTKLPGALVTKIKEDSKGNIWALTWGGGFCKLNTETKKCKQYLPHKIYTQQQKEYANAVTDMLELKDGRFLIVYFSNESCGFLPDYFNPISETFEPFDIQPYLKKNKENALLKLDMLLKICRFVYQDSNNDLWFGTYSGLFYLNTKTYKAERISGQVATKKLNYEHTTSYIIDENQNMWVATPNAGIMIVNTKNRQLKYITHDFKNTTSVLDNSIHSFNKDADNNIWVHSGFGDYNVYTPLKQQFSISEWDDMNLNFDDRSVQKIPVNQLLVKNNGYLYITNENGICVYDPSINQIIKTIKPKFKTLDTLNFEIDLSPFRVYDIKQFNEANYAIISPRFPGIYNEKTETFTRPSYPNSLKKITTRLLFRHLKQTSQTAYVINKSNYEIIEWDITKNTLNPFYKFKEKKEVKENFSFILKTGNWLLSLGEKEFCIFNPQTKIPKFYNVHSKQNYFPDSTIKIAYLDKEGTVWFGTSNGLYQFDELTGKAINMNVLVGISNEPVNSIICDKEGIWWFALEKTLLRWDRKENKSIRFNTKLGLQAGGFIGAIAQTDSIGKIYIAAYYGVLVFDPSKVIIPNNALIPTLSGLAIKDDTLSYERLTNFITTHPQLKWNQNFLNFEFASNQIYTPTPHQFFVRLNGLDTTWQNNGISNKINYTNLSSGNYTLQVKIKNCYNIESETLNIEFEILAPFWLKWWFYLIVVSVLIILIYAYIKYRERSFIEQQQVLENRIQERTAEVVAKAEEITIQKELIEDKNKELTDSIYYAQRIQQSILPNETEIAEGLPQHFILFKPKDIVSGDFYWYTKQGDLVLWAVVDCTGHGVPGGFMSMLGSGLLNQIVNEELKLKPDDILNNLRDRVIIALKQTGNFGENKDGMDITFCSYNRSTNLLQFAGANNELYIVRNNELIELSADKQPIGIHIGNKKNFTLKELQLQIGDSIFMTSDGYADQFGGPKGKKFKTKNLEKLLIEISGLTCKQQLNILDKTFIDWKGNHYQLDDVCLFGFKVS